MKRNRTLIGVALLLTTVLVTLVWAHEGHKAITTKGVRIDDKGLLHMEAPARKAVGLSTAKVDFGTIEETVPLNARVVLPWNKSAFASSRVEGVVKRILVRPGQKVKAGDPLALIESLPVEALRLELRQTEIELSLAEQNVKRAVELGESIIAGREILALEARRDDRKYTLGVLRKKLEAIGPKVGKEISVTSPIDGTVVHVDVVLGRHVEPTEHLFSIHDTRVVWVNCEVPENLISLIAPGQNARLTFFAYPKRAWSGAIELSSYSVDKTQNTRHVVIPLDNKDGLLLPGMFGSATVVTRAAKDVFTVPLGAIVTDGAERYAFVQQQEVGVYKKSNVLLGARNGRFAEVLAGLYPGDTVITAGNHEISSLFVRGTLELSAEAKKNIGFAVLEIGYRSVDRVFEVNARVVSPPDRHSVSTNRIEGKIEKIHVLIGQEVKAGQALADVSSLELQNKQLDLILVHLQRKLVSTQLGYVQALAKKGISPRKELLRLESEALQLDSRFETIRRSLVVMGLSESDIAGVIKAQEPVPALSIRARLGGRVSGLHVVVGQVVRPGEEIFDIVDLGTVWVVGSFFESDLAALFDGPVEKPTAVRTVAYGDRKWEARISFVNGALNGGENILQGWVEIDNEDGTLLPGMHATLIVTEARPQEKVIAIPIRAVLSVGRKQYVFVEKGKQFKRVEVALGRKDANNWEVRDGLFPGDRVVVSGVNEMNNAFSAVR